MFLSIWISLLVAVASLFSASPEGKKTQQPAEKIDYILVIPFSPQMYINNGEHFICKSSNINPGELNDMIRRSMENTMIYNLGEYFNAKGLKDAALSDPQSDISKIYDITNYQRKNKRLLAYYKNYPPFTIREMLSPRHVRWGTDCVNKDLPKPNSRRHTYAKAVIEKDSLYADILKKNEAIYAVFLTQFEMNTRFKTCLDLHHNVFQRDIFLHYTLLDSAGKYMDGGVVGTTWQSQTNDIKVIMDKNLGMLAGLIAERIRKKI